VRAITRDARRREVSEFPRARELHGALPKRAAQVPRALNRGSIEAAAKTDADLYRACIDVDE